MTSIAELRRQADLRKHEFLQSARVAIENTAPLRLLDEAAGTVDPGFSVLERITRQAQANPFILLAGAVGVWLVMRPFIDSASDKTTSRRRRGVQARLPSL